METKADVMIPVDLSSDKHSVANKNGKTPRPKSIQVTNIIDAPEPPPKPLPPQVVMLENPNVETTLVKMPCPSARDLVMKALEVDDTPHSRAEKIQAMADAAKAHAKLYDLGIMNNAFLMTNEGIVTECDRAKIKELESKGLISNRVISSVPVKKSRKGLVIGLSILGLLLVAGGVVGALIGFNIISF